MSKSDNKPASVPAEEVEMSAEEIDDVTGGHTGGVNQAALGTNANSRLCDGSVRPGDGSVKPGDGSVKILIGL